MFQQITGINTVIYFAPIIFQSAGLSSAATSILATAGVGAVNVIMTIVSIRLIDRLGRRQLLFWSLGGMAVTLFVLSGAFFAGTSGELAWIAVLSVAAYVGFFAIGLGPVFWLLIAEIFPLALRGRAMSLATVANWGFNLIVSATFLNLVGAVGSAGAFLVYGVLSLVALAFIATTVPETKGRSLEQIEAALDSWSVAPVPSVAGEAAMTRTLALALLVWPAAAFTAAAQTPKQCLGLQVFPQAFDPTIPPFVAPGGEHLLGDWGGIRPELESHGIYLRLNAVAEFAGNTGGAEAGRNLGQPDCVLRRHRLAATGRTSRAFPRI